MSMAMAAVDDTPVPTEIADVVDCVFSYSFISRIIKWGGPQLEERLVFELIFIKIASRNKIITEIILLKQRKKWI